LDNAELLKKALKKGDILERTIQAGFDDKRQGEIAEISFMK